MKCMGITSLAIVAEAIIDPTQARTLAHGAADVLEAAVVYPDLASAVADATLVAGTTRRRGKNRKYFTVFPEQLAERIAAAGQGTAAVVFGNEETGLTDEELALCNLAVTIPASPESGSLNLSHAVQVVCYALARAAPGRLLTPFTPIASAEVDALVSVITRSLKAIGFFHLVTPRSMTVFFRDILARAGLSVNEAKRMGIVFRKIAGIATKGGIEPEGAEPGEERPGVIDPGGDPP
jgi:tRNA/rRNA methyltransferase